MRDLRAEQFPDPLDRGQRVLDDVVEQAGRNRDGIELEIDEELGDGQGVDEVGFPGTAHLAPVLERREDVRPSEQFDVSVGAVGPDLLQQVFESNH